MSPGLRHSATQFENKKAFFCFTGGFLFFVFIFFLDV